MTKRSETRGQYFGRCAACGKLCYESRRAARRAARAAHRGEQLHAYECTPGVWHYGHNSYQRRQGYEVAEYDGPVGAASATRRIAAASGDSLAGKAVVESNDIPPPGDPSGSHSQGDPL